MHLRSLLVAIVLVAATGVLAAEDAPEPRIVKFPTSDGKTISAFEWGKGATAIILCHGRAYTTGGASFARECAFFATKGVRCLALNFRGYPADAPPTLKGKELDILGAFGYLATHGARSIFVLGSSMGGFTALAALDSLTAQPQFAGLVVISAMQIKTPVAAACPKLFFVAEDDKQLYPYVQMMFYKAAPPKQAVVFKHGGHGQRLFKNHGQQMVQQILLFVDANRMSIDRKLDIELPKTHDPPRPAADAMTIRVVGKGKDARLLVDGATVTIEKLAEKLKAAIAADRDQAVLVRADRDVSHQVLAGVLSACHEAGVRDVRVATAPEGHARP